MEQGSTVLLVEDDETDAFFFQRAVAKGKFPYRINVARNGLEAKQYLSGEGEFADREKFPFPKFIVTDNRMPLMSGKEFLLWLKGHPQFNVVPTIILGGKDDPASIDEAYQKLGAHSYIVKPSINEELERIVRLIFEYWAVCQVPRCKLKESG
jgi:CheY-like chemotaxis protein